MRFVLSAGLLCLVTLASVAQVQPARLYPQPAPYLLEHFDLHGPVEMVTTYNAKGTLLTQEVFDRASRITKSVNFSGMTSSVRYEYEPAQNLIHVYYQTGTLPESKQVYQTNDRGQLLYQLHKIDDPLRQFDYSDGLLVRDTGANRFSKDKVYYRYYKYDKQKRVVASKSYNGGDVLSREEEYTYADRVVTIQGKSYSAYAPTSTYEKKLYYNSKGFLEKSTYATNGKLETTDFQLDQYGNWISKTGGPTRVIKYYDQVAKQPVQQTPAKMAVVPPKDKGQTFLLDESFDDNQRNWSVWDNTGASVQITQGAYRFFIKERNNFLSWYGLPEFAANQQKDFMIKAGFSLGTTDTGNPNDSYWLTWGLGNNGKDYYAFGIYPEGKFQYGRLAANSWNAKAGNKASSAVRAGPNQRNHLQVEKRGDSIFFSVNEKLVLRDRYEVFPTTFAGIGFQFNNPKQIDVEYLQVRLIEPAKPSAKIQAPTSQTVVPSHVELAYQTDLQQSKNSVDRAKALLRYCNSLRSSTLTNEQVMEQIRLKCQALREIDFYGMFEFRQMAFGKDMPMELAKMVFTIYRNLLTPEQSDVIDFYVKERAYQPGVKIYNQTTGQMDVVTSAMAWPSNAPRPGYGWNKTVSSNPVPAPTVAAASADRTAEYTLEYWNEHAKQLQGGMIYMLAGKRCYSIQNNIKLKSENDLVELSAIRSNYTYSVSAGRNVFGITTASQGKMRVSLKSLVRMLNESGTAVMISGVGPCVHCAGTGGTWDARSKTKGFCQHCNGSGCLPN